MWIYLPSTYLASVQESEELNSDLSWPKNTSESDFAQSVWWRGKCMQPRYWLKKWNRETWMRVLFGRTLRHSQKLLNGFVGKFTSSLEDTHVNPSLLLDSERERKMNDTFSQIFVRLSRQLDLFGVSLKTSLDTYDLDSQKFTRAYEVWVTQLRQDCLQREKLGQVINASDCLSWPIPNARDETRDVLIKRDRLPDKAISWRTPSNQEAGVKMERLKGKLGTRLYDKETGRLAQYGLSQQVSLQAQETEKPGKQSSESGPNLPRLWMTPKSGKCGATAKTKDRPIEMATHLTTQTHTWKTPHGIHRFDRHGNMGGPGELGHQAKHCLTPNKNKKLNPLFVEWLMGLPIGWTALEPVEMQSYLSRQRGLLSVLCER